MVDMCEYSSANKKSWIGLALPYSYSIADNNYFSASKFDLTSVGLTVCCTPEEFSCFPYFVSCTDLFTVSQRVCVCQP